MFIKFNQNATCFVVINGGVFIYNCNPFQKQKVELPAHLQSITMLNTSSLLALVGDGVDPLFSTRTLRLWNTAKRQSICELNMATTILSGNINLFPFHK